MWVVASKDYTYGHEQVKAGQVFELRGCRNDGLLLKHRLALPLEPQPDAEALKRFPQCGECGRRFRYPQQRERCGELHEMSAAKVRDARHDAAGKRLDGLRRAGELPA